MDKKYIHHLIDTLTEKNNLKLVKEEAAKYYKTKTVDECFDAVWNFISQIIFKYRKSVFSS